MVASGLTVVGGVVVVVVMIVVVAVVVAATAGVVVVVVVVVIHVVFLEHSGTIAVLSFSYPHLFSSWSGAPLSL